jgi:integrase-like protein
VPKGGRVGGALDPGDVAQIYKAMARAAGLSAAETARISGHSTRIGASQHMIRYGMELPAVMQAGRWRTPEMVARYTGRLTAHHSAATQVLDRRVAF